MTTKNEQNYGQSERSDNSLLLCGCGREGRYLSTRDPSKLSCNKYSRCPSYVELVESVKKLNKRLFAYQQAVNQIDDYFECAMESRRDQKKVHQIIGNLTDGLKDT